MSSVAGLLAATNIYAAQSGRDVCPDDIKPGPFAFTYAKDLGLSCPSDFYAFGEYLLIQAQEEGLEYALAQTDQKSETLSNALYFPLKGGNILSHSSGHNDWDFNSGVRAGFGFYLGHDAWNLEGNWTYFRLKTESSNSIGGSGLLLPLMLPATLVPGISAKDASQRWTGHHNVFDLIIGKPFHASRFFILNPFAGVRASWLDQQIINRYSGGYRDVVGTGIKMESTNDSNGLGLGAGLKSEFLLGAGCELFVNSAISMVYGKFNVSQQLGVTSYPNYNYELDQDFYATQPNLDLALGLKWAYMFSKNNASLSLAVAYEFHEWFKQNRLRKFTSGHSLNSTGSVFEQSITTANLPYNGDLSYNGLSFRLQFDF
jgi:hypothetical protein